MTNGRFMLSRTTRKTLAVVIILLTLFENKSENADSIDQTIDLCEIDQLSISIIQKGKGETEFYAVS
jgi:hypothetical protein